MQGIGDAALEYGRQVEALLEQLGARGPVKGAGGLLEQVQHLIDPEGLRKVRWFLKLRNKVAHNKPVEMPMPSREEVERAGRAAVAVLEGVLAAGARQANATFHPPQQNERQEEPPGPVYRIRERDGAYELWVGPSGVWVVAEGREALQKAQLEAEVRLVTRFPRLAVRAGRRARGLEARLRWGRKRLSPEEVLEVVRLLTQRAAPTPRPAGPEQTSRSRVRRVKLTDVPATFYVGPAGVLVVAEFALIARTEAQRVWEGSGGAIAAVPAVLDPRLKEARWCTGEARPDRGSSMGRVDGVLALRDEGAIRDYLQGGHGLDKDEVNQVVGWLQNRLSPVPTLRDKRGRYGLRGEEVTEGRTKAPPAFVVEPVPPSAPPAPSRGVAMAKGLSWRVAFLPELVLFAVGAVVHPELWLVVGVLLLRFQASFGDDLLLWKRWVLLVVGGLELAFVWAAVGDEVQRFVQAVPKASPALAGTLLLMWLAILIPGLLSLFRGIWLFWPRRKSPSPFRMSSPSGSRVR